MLVVTPDANLRRAIKRLTTSTGASADFIAESTAYDAQRSPQVVVYDARQSDVPKKLLAGLAPEAKVLCIVDGDHLAKKLTMLADERLCSLFCHDERFDDDEFIASATKALRGEVFGLQKYFPWGVTAYSMLVKSHADKGVAIETMLEYASLAGVRGAVKDRIQLVCDELMMNGLYHAPTDAQGNEKYAGRPVKELAQLAEVSPIRVQYGHSGRYFGLSVRDSFGSLKREKLLEYLKKAHGGAQMESKAGGAGLGLVSVLKSASKLVFNLDPGTATEVIALFDMELAARGKVGARSLHLFMAAKHEDRSDDRGREARAKPLATTGMWAAIAVLCAILGGMVGVLVLKKSGTKPADAAEALPPPLPSRIVLENAVKGTVLKVGGRIVNPGEPIEIQPGATAIPVVIEKPN